MPNDRDLAQQWLAERLEFAGVDWRESRNIAESVLDTPGVEVETMTMYVGKPGGSWVAETRLHIMMPVESIHV
jgi:hypothetical protein